MATWQWHHVSMATWQWHHVSMADSHYHAYNVLWCFMAPNLKLTAVTACMWQCLKLKTYSVWHYLYLFCTIAVLHVIVKILAVGVYFLSVVLSMYVVVNWHFLACNPHASTLYSAIIQYIPWTIRTLFAIYRHRGVLMSQCRNLDSYRSPWSSVTASFQVYEKLLRTPKECTQMAVMLPRDLQQSHHHECLNQQQLQEPWQ